MHNIGFVCWINPWSHVYRSTAALVWLREPSIRMNVACGSRYVSKLIFYAAIQIRRIFCVSECVSSFDVASLLVLQFPLNVRLLIFSFFFSFLLSTGEWDCTILVEQSKCRKVIVKMVIFGFYFGELLSHSTHTHHSPNAIQSIKINFELLFLRVFSLSHPNSIHPCGRRRRRRWRWQRQRRPQYTTARNRAKKIFVNCFKPIEKGSTYFPPPNMTAI